MLNFYRNSSNYQNNVCLRLNSFHELKVRIDWFYDGQQKLNFTKITKTHLYFDWRSQSHACIATFIFIEQAKHLCSGVFADFVNDCSTAILMIMRHALIMNVSDCTTWIVLIMLSHCFHWVIHGLYFGDNINWNPIMNDFGFVSQYRYFLFLRYSNLSINRTWCRDWDKNRYSTDRDRLRKHYDAQPTKSRHINVRHF